MKICLTLPTLTMGGMERVMSGLAGYFNEKENLDIVFVLHTQAERFYEVPSEIRIIEPSFFYKKYSRLVFTFKTFAYLRKTLKKEKPDIVLSFGERYNSFVIISSFFLNTKVFISDRSKPDKNLGWLHNFLRKYSYRFAHGIICQTEVASKIMFARTYHKNIKIIGNPIKQFENKDIKKEKIILTVGRLIPSKRVDLLLRLFSQTDYTDWKLIVAGEGPEMRNLEILSKQMGLTDNVVFAGNIKDLSFYYSVARIFAFTSNSEGFPNALGEAMMAGLSPISFNFIAGSGDLVKDGQNGFLVPMDEEQVFVDKLNILMKDESLCETFSSKAKEHCFEEFSANKIGEKYYDFLMQ